jgi:hypothetical protein
MNQSPRGLSVSEQFSIHQASAPPTPHQLPSIFQAAHQICLAMHSPISASAHQFRFAMHSPISPFRLLFIPALNSSSKIPRYAICVCADLIYDFLPATRRLCRWSLLQRHHLRQSATYT